MEPRTWNRRDPKTKQTYLVSTRREYISLPFITSAFATSDMYWAKPMPDADMQTMLDNSLNIGLYVTAPAEGGAIYSELQQIGMMRLITDYVTFAYITDVFVQEDYRGKGLATWLVECCQEVIDGFPDGFRRSFLMASNTKWAIPFYGKTMGMFVPEQDVKTSVFMTAKRVVKPKEGDEEKTTE